MKSKILTQALLLGVVLWGIATACWAEESLQKEQAEEQLLNLSEEDQEIVKILELIEMLELLKDIENITALEDSQ